MATHPALLMALMKGKGKPPMGDGAEDDGAEDQGPAAGPTDPALVDAAHDILAALETKDPDQLASALKNFIDTEEGSEEQPPAPPAGGAAPEGE